MVAIARKTGSLQVAAGTVYTPGAKAFKILVKIANGTAGDLRAEDDAENSGATPPIIVVETVEAIVREINPIVYMTTNDNSGTMTVVCDSSATAADLQHRIRTIAGDWDRDTDAYSVSTVGPNTIDTSGTLVTDAATLVAT